MKYQMLSLIICGTGFLMLGFQQCSPIKAASGGRNSASVIDAAETPPNIPSDTTEIINQPSPVTVYSLATGSSSGGTVVKLLANDVEANLGPVDWYINGNFTASSSRLSLSSTALAGFSTCKYSVKAIFAEDGVQQERSASFNVDGCVVSAPGPQNLAGCPMDWKATSATSPLAWSNEFGRITFADLGSNAYGGGMLKLYSMNKTTPISFKIASEFEGGYFSTADSSGMLYVRWAVSISGSACPGHFDLSYSSPCSSKYGVKWVRADLAKLYPDRCALEPGKTYYLNMRVFAPMQNNTYCTNSSGIELSSLGWAPGKCAITASGINKAVLPAP